MEEIKSRTKVIKEMEDCYYRADEVAKYLSMGLSTVWDKSKHNKDDFPSGKKISERISVWRKSDLDDWVNRNDES